MSSGQPATAHPRDTERINASSRQIGMLVGLASAVIIAAGTAVLVFVILASSRPELDRGRATADPDHIVVDVDRVVPWVLGFGVVAVLLLWMIAWLAARRSVRPLAEALRLQREFVADASHELRTPLTALASRIQLLERRIARGEPTDEVVAKLRRDADAMAETLTELLTLAAADSGQETEHRGDPVVAFQSAMDRLATLAETRGVHLRSSVVIPSGDTHPLVALSESAFSRACIVLLDNALQYTPVGGSVTARCEVQRGRVEVSISDQGPGIAETAQARIFERFARGEETGSRSGYGLGLALARELADRAGGTVRIVHSSPEGTEFLLLAPRVD